MSVSKRVYAEILYRATILKIYIYYRGKDGIKKVGSGRTTRYVAMCPFHEEKTPSFNLYKGSDSFSCWGCGVSGGQIDLIRCLEGGQNVSHSTCLQKLAEIAHVSIPSGRTNLQRARRRVRSSTRKRLLKKSRPKNWAPQQQAGEQAPY